MRNHHDIVAIGGSAGALEALLRILPDLPVELPATIFVVVHIGAESPNLLPQLFTTHGNLPAQEAAHDAPFRRGHIYVAPPDYHLLLEKKRMLLSHGAKVNGFRPAIDPLFRSVARHFGPRVIGLVLSGDLDDGTAGLTEIKLHGGIALVQDPADAPFPSMPKSAVANVELDHVVPLHKIAARLADLVRTPATARSAAAGSRRRLAARDSSERTYDKDGLALPGRARNFSCPECGGAMWELTGDNQLRYRCHTGHIHSAASLGHQQQQTLDNALWTAIRSLQEAAELRRRMAARLERGALQTYAKEYLKIAEEADAGADVLREFLHHSRRNSDAQSHRRSRPLAKKRAR
jgi:two-component system chemotaxis response regulator CheB